MIVDPQAMGGYIVISELTKEYREIFPDRRVLCEEETLKSIEKR